MARPKKEKPNARGLYEVTISLGHDVTGKPIRKHFYSTVSKDAARQKAEDWKVKEAVALTTGIFAEKNVTFRQLAEQIRDIKKSEMKYSSWNTGFHSPIDLHLIPYFGDTLVKNIKKLDIDRYFVSKKDLAVSTLQRHKLTLNIILEEAVNNDIIMKNPMRKFKLNVGRPEKQKNIMSHEHMMYLLEYCRHNPSIMSVAVDLIARYGISRSELLGIQNQSVDKENKVIYIVQSVTRQQYGSVPGQTKNKYRNRPVVISQSTVDLLNSLESEIRGEYLISFSEEGTLTPVDSFNFHYTKWINDFRSYYNNKGIEIPFIHIHEFRHTRASHWVAEDKNLFAVAQQMGWANLDMLRKRYGHAETDTVRNLLDIH